MSEILRKTGVQRKTPRGTLSAFSVNLAVGESSLTEFSSPEGTLFVKTLSFSNSVSACLQGSYRFRDPFGAQTERNRFELQASNLKPGGQPAKLRPSSSFRKIEIHRPPGFETQPERQPAPSPQYNGNSGNDFRRHPRSQTLCHSSNREITTRHGRHLLAPISPATLAPLGLSHCPGLSSVWIAEDVPKHTVATAKQFWQKRNLTAR